jgi:hypothetical protein
VTCPVDESTVAKDVLLLVYVTEPELALLAVTVNAASVTFLVAVEVANVKLGVAFDTVSVLLVFVAPVNRLGTASCVALKLTSPGAIMFIQLPDASIVATDVLLLVYVIAPLLLLVGRVVIANDASPYALVDATLKVDDERVGMPNDTSSILLVVVALVY